MKLNILKYICVALPLAGMTACMDFDTPSDEFSKDQVVVDPEIPIGNADKLDFTKEITEEGFAEAEQALANHFRVFQSAQYIAGGGKNGEEPGPHAYQYAYSLTTDNYAGYFTMYAGTMSGDLLYTYQYLPKYCDGPYFKLTGMSDMVNMLHTSYADSIVEVKAMGLLLYNNMAQEMTDIYGSVPYFDFKNNKKENPFTFDKPEDIYKGIISNIDDIVACLGNFGNRPQWYQDKVRAILSKYDVITLDKSVETWRRYANSLKLRMAMHLVKVMPNEAKQWAEEAVASGVIENASQQIGYNLTSNGLTGANPLKMIFEWDTRLNASFETMLFSLNHPYTKYFFTKNSHPITNNVDPKEVMAAQTRVIGLRAGMKMETSQQFYGNPRFAYSKIENEIVMWMPIYLMKWAEVDFLRAEGCLRGWNMGGELASFYERGIRNATAEDVFAGVPRSMTTMWMIICRWSSRPIIPISTLPITATIWRA